MAKYKNNTPQIVEGFLEKMFGALATTAGQKVAKDLAKKDPEMGKLLARAQGLMKQADKRIKGMSRAELDQWKRDTMNDLDW